MKNTANHRVRCDICGKDVARSSAMPAAIVRPALADIIRRDHPDWPADGNICLTDLNRYRGIYVQDVLETERGELSALEQDVVRSLRDHELLSQNINQEFETQTTFGQKVADSVASFGGSWSFIISFGVILVVWITINTHLVLSKPFDPFPFILLNLVLSCLAAMQAPVIMMSQNRQEAKDRLRSEHDYRVNLKAELEIRQLHSKLDLLLTHQWQRLLEIQQVQTDLLEEMSGRKQR
ncbi:MAG: DUF1003 domain-containing protein [Planctomycetaceae bacterium]